ncbi:hypothetical protein [Burkholderia diffusa]|uniref:hypothetical protein n=2 Tax=Burkholderia diffusa TaxID=488732 RepID=UPI001589CAD9|nr:hypothetical protein [Burkholderia diffusa]
MSISATDTGSMANELQKTTGNNQNNGAPEKRAGLASRLSAPVIGVIDPSQAIALSAQVLAIFRARSPKRRHYRTEVGRVRIQSENYRISPHPRSRGNKR